MHSKKTNPLVQWWMTSKLPYEDIYELPLLKNNTRLSVVQHYFSQWLIHPIKRRLARYYLKFLQKFTNIKVIGITGSAGKSTTTQILQSILSKDGHTVFTPHSIDPVYNIPNTILRCNLKTRYLILEMSVEYKGEMDYYLWLAQPDIGIITNIFPSHLKNLKNVKGVFEEKSKLVKRLDDKGVAVLNNNDKHLKRLKNRLNSKVIWFNGESNPIEANKNAAKAASSVLGVDKDIVEKGIENFVLPKHRLNLVKLKNGVNILDDSYNSNPEAAIAALNYFGSLAKKNKKIAVLGDMLELGEFESEAHKSLGMVASKIGFEYVIGVGKAVETTINEIKNRSKSSKVDVVSSVDQVFPKISRLVKSGTYVFIKGSRSIGLDKLVLQLSQT